MARRKKIRIKNQELRIKNKKRKKRVYKKKTFAREPQKNFSLYFLIIGVVFLLMGGFLFLLLNKKNGNLPQLSPSPIIHLVASLSAQTQPIKIDPEFSYQEEQLKQEVPIKVVIPSVKVDVPIVEAQIIDGYWETATNSASFGLGSAYPSQVGNTVIFAHAREGLFANLAYLQKEADVYLFTKSNWFAYKVEEIKTVFPDQVEVVSPSKDKTLTLFTCGGYRDAYRLVVVAKPI